MGEKKVIRIFEIVTLLIVIATALLSVLYNNAFVPSFMLMLALFIFEICYDIKDNKKTMMYVLFIIGVLLILGSLFNVVWVCLKAL